MDDINLIIKKEVLEFIVDKAILLNLGARGLRSICEAILTEWNGNIFYTSGIIVDTLHDYFFSNNYSFINRVIFCRQLNYGFAKKTYT